MALSNQFVHVFVVVLQLCSPWFKCYFLAFVFSPYKTIPNDEGNKIETKEKFEPQHSPSL